MATPSGDPPFRHVGIVGAGLIGGSIALALRRASPTVRIAVVDRPEVTRLVLANGAADEALPSVDLFFGVDLIVLATPIPAITNMLASYRFPTGAVVTDVGSTKRAIHAAAADAGVPDFVGGHPMAGRERGGFEHASADLFDSRRWFLVRGQGTERSAVDRVAAFVASLGASAHEIAADEHDRTMAYVSHLPQLVASLLMRRVDLALGPAGLESAGRGLEDTTRLASSPSDIWRGILASNADLVREAAAALAQDLTNLGGDLSREDAVGRTFDDGRRARDRWLASRRTT